MNARISTLFLALALLPAPSLVRAGSADLDEARSGWKFRRSVTINAAVQPAGFAALPLPPEVAAAAQPDLRDLRLVDADGREVPFVVDRKTDRQGTRRWDGDLTDMRSDKKLRTVWTVDFREPRRFDIILLRIDDTDFAKRFRVEASDDGAGWRELVADAGIFDRQWNFRVHHTVIQLPSPQTARYLRLTADDQRSAPILIRGVTARIAREVAGERWSRRAGIESQSDEGTTRRYRLDLPPGLPIEKVEIESDDVAFSRRVTLIEEREVSGRRTRVVLGKGEVYRLKLEDDGLSGEALSFLVSAPRSGRLVLEVQNGDSPPLRNLRVTVSGVASRVLFPVGGGGSRPPGAMANAEESRPEVAIHLTLYYANTATRAAVYDLEMLKSQLGLNPRFIAAELGTETPNPRYRPVPPMQFVAAHGAALETRQWKMGRGLTLPKREDIYTVTLAASDLAVLRPDLGDLRIVGSSGRQIPLILESNAAEAEVALRVEPDTRPAKRGQRGVVSRYRLTVEGADDKAMTLPLQQLRLSVSETFFSRPATLTVPSHDPRHGDRVLFSRELSRQAGQRGPVQLNLDGGRYDTLFLQVEEGDNAPLTLEKARAIVSVPRVVFKLKPEEDSYRLLLGNEQAQPPRYDIQTLQREVLAYSAVPASLAPIEPNPAYRRFAADYFKSAPPTVLLWGVLLLAVVGLLALTVRLLKKTPA